MGNLSIIRSGYKADIQDALTSGLTVVDILRSSFRPSLIYSKGGSINPQLIACNYGNFREQHRFISFIGGIDDNSDEAIISLDQLADIKVLVRGSKTNLNFYLHSEKLVSQQGFCEFLYDGSAQDAVMEFLLRGYSIFDIYCLEKLNDLAEKGKIMGEFNRLTRMQERERARHLKSVEKAWHTLNTRR